jgi:hypothetical protein
VVDDGTDRYRPHARGHRALNIALAREVADERGDHRYFVNELHDALWTELVSVANDAPFLGRYMGETDEQLRARLSVSMSSRATADDLEARLALVVTPEHKLELITNATEPAIVRVAVTPADDAHRDGDRLLPEAARRRRRRPVRRRWARLGDRRPSIQMWQWIAPMNVVRDDPTPMRVPLRALSDEQLDEAVVECDRMIRDGRGARRPARRVLGARGGR